VTVDAPPKGWTPNELARLLRVSPDQIRAWCKSGVMKSLNVARHACSKPRYIILPHHLAEFERSRSGAQPKAPPRRRRTSGEIDFYPD
jgi:hypothetical protein